MIVSYVKNWLSYYVIWVWVLFISLLASESELVPKLLQQQQQQSDGEPKSEEDIKPKKTKKIIIVKKKKKKSVSEGEDDKNETELLPVPRVEGADEGEEPKLAKAVDNEPENIEILEAIPTNPTEHVNDVLRSMVSDYETYFGEEKDTDGAAIEEEEEEEEESCNSDLKSIQDLGSDLGGSLGEERIETEDNFVDEVIITDAKGGRLNEEVIKEEDNLTDEVKIKDANEGISDEEEDVDDSLWIGVGRGTGLTRYSGVQNLLTAEEAPPAEEPPTVEFRRWSPVLIPRREGPLTLTPRSSLIKSLSQEKDRLEEIPEEDRQPSPRIDSNTSDTSDKIWAQLVARYADESENGQRRPLQEGDEAIKNETTLRTGSNYDNGIDLRKDFSDENMTSEEFSAEVGKRLQIYLEKIEEKSENECKMKADLASSEEKIDESEKAGNYESESERHKIIILIEDDDSNDDREEEASINKINEASLEEPNPHTFTTVSDTLKEVIKATSDECMELGLENESESIAESHAESTVLHPLLDIQTEHIDKLVTEDESEIHCAFDVEAPIKEEEANTFKTATAEEVPTKPELETDRLIGDETKNTSTDDLDVPSQFEFDGGKAMEQPLIAVEASESPDDDTPVFTIKLKKKVKPTSEEQVPVTTEPVQEDSEMAEETVIPTETQTTLEDEDQNSKDLENFIVDFKQEDPSTIEALEEDIEDKIDTNNLDNTKNESVLEMDDGGCENISDLRRSSRDLWKIECEKVLDEQQNSSDKDTYNRRTDIFSTTFEEFPEDYISNEVSTLVDVSKDAEDVISILENVIDEKPAEDGHTREIVEVPEEIPEYVEPSGDTEDPSLSIKREVDTSHFSGDSAMKEDPSEDSADQPSKRRKEVAIEEPKEDIEETVATMEVANEALDFECAPKPGQLINVCDILTHSEQNLVARILAQNSNDDAEDWLTDDFEEAGAQQHLDNIEIDDKFDIDVKSKFFWFEEEPKTIKMLDSEITAESYLLETGKNSEEDALAASTSVEIIDKEEIEDTEIPDETSAAVSVAAAEVASEKSEVDLKEDLMITKESLTEKEIILELIRKERNSDARVLSDDEIPEYLDEVKDLLVPRARRKKAKNRFSAVGDILNAGSSGSQFTMKSVNEDAKALEMDVDTTVLKDELYESSDITSKQAGPDSEVKDEFLLTEEEQRELDEIKSEQEAFKVVQRRELEKFLSMPASLTEQEQRELEEFLAEEETDKGVAAASEARLEAILSDVRQRLKESGIDVDDENLDRFMTLPVDLTDEEQRILTTEEEKGRNDFETDDEYRDYIKQRYLEELEEDRVRVEEEEIEFGEYYDDGYDYDDEFEYDEDDLEGDYDPMNDYYDEGTKESQTKDEAVGTEELSKPKAEENTKKSKKFFSIPGIRSKTSSRGSSTRGSRGSLDKNGSKDSIGEGATADESKDHAKQSKFFRFGSLSVKRKKKNDHFPLNKPGNPNAEVETNPMTDTTVFGESDPFTIINIEDLEQIPESLKKRRLLVLLKSIKKYNRTKIQPCDTFDNCLTGSTSLRGDTDNILKDNTLETTRDDRVLGKMEGNATKQKTLSTKALKELSNKEKKNEISDVPLPLIAYEGSEDFRTTTEHSNAKWSVAEDSHFIDKPNSNSDSNQLESDEFPIPPPEDHRQTEPDNRDSKSLPNEEICGSGDSKVLGNAKPSSAFVSSNQGHKHTVNDINFKILLDEKLLNKPSNRRVKDVEGKAIDVLELSNTNDTTMSGEGDGLATSATSNGGACDSPDEELWPEENNTSEVVLDEFERMEQEVILGMEKETQEEEKKKKREGDKKGKKKKKRRGESEKENKKTAYQNRDELYEKHVGPRVRSFDTAKMKSKFNKPKEPSQVSSDCRICGKQVFQMEKIVAEKASWHKNCFRCKECNKNLTLETYQSHEGCLYCKPHFKELFRPKAVVQDEAEERKDRLLRRPRMIVLESKPEALPEDVVRATEKPDYGLEELQQSLNVRERFAVFENLGKDEEKPKTEPVSVRRSQSLMSKAAKFLDGHDDKPYGDPDGEYEDESMDDEEEEEGEEEEGEDGEIIVKSKKKKERPMSFAGMGDLKSNWEQKQRREEMSQSRKEEITRFRQMLCAGKNLSLKEKFESGNFDDHEENDRQQAKEEIKIEGKRAASNLKKRFEQGEPFILEDEDEDDDEDAEEGEEGKPRRNRRKVIGSEKQEVEEIFKEAETAKKARNVFMQIDSRVAKEGTAVLRSHSFATSNRDNRLSFDASVHCQPTTPTSADIVKAGEKSEDFHVDTTDLVSRFKFFSNYEKDKEKERESKRKVFRITPPREGIDQVEDMAVTKAIMPKPCMAVNCTVCKLRGRQGSDDLDMLGRDPNLIKCTDNYQDDVDCRNTKNLLQMFKKMEMAQDEDEDDDAPRPLKRFTPPPGAEEGDEEGSDEEYSDEEYTDEEEDDDEVVDEGNNASKVRDELLQMLSARKAASLRAKFEKWEAEVERQNDLNKEREDGEEECMPSLDTAKNLRAMFEHKAIEVTKPVASKPITQKVNRFV